MKKKAMKNIAIIISAVMLMQVCYLSTFAAFIVTLNETTAPRAAKYATVNLLSGSHALSAGRAGTVSFDDYTLEVKASFDLPETDNGLFAPAEQSLSYGSNAQAFLENIANTPAESFGGWMMPILSYVCEVVDGEDSGAVWYDRYGNAVVFDEVPIEEPEQGEAPSELEKIFTTDNEAYDGFVLLKCSDATMAAAESSDDMYGVRYLLLPQNHEESDINQVYRFDDNGRIMNAIDLTDSYVSSFTYVENGAFDAISSVTDLLGNEYRYTYTNGKVTKIKCYNSDGDAVSLGTGTNADPLETNFEYYEDTGLLKKVIFPDGEYIIFIYDANGKLIEVINIDASKIVLTYNVNGYVTGMSKQFEDEQGVYQVSNSVTVTVPALNQRCFVDETGYTIIKTFDEDGNILTVYDGDGHCLFDNTVVPEEPTTEPIEEPTTAPVESTTDLYESVTASFEDVTDVFYCFDRFGCDCCSDCQELNCECTCASEAECTCPQCKRYYEEITTDFGDIVNVIETISFDGVRAMTELSTYTENGAFLTSSTDSAGNTVYYVYNTDSGLLQSLSSGNSTVNFGYDAMGNLTSLAQQVSGLTNGSVMQNTYGYTDDRITSITHNGFSYEFEYDTFGNQTQVKIGTLPLITYDYDEDATEDAPVTSITYANNQTVCYTYNENGQIASISYDGGNSERYEYEYDQDGVLISVTDADAEQVTVYTEDGIEIRADNNAQTLFFSVTANSDGTVTRTAFDRAVTETDDSDYDPATGVTTDTASYYREIFDEDGPDYYAENRFETQTDWFGRVTGKEATVKSGMLGSNRYVEENNGTYSYTYYDTETEASAQVKSLAYGYSSQTYSRDYENFYEYDNKGNITGVYQLDGTDKVYSHKYYYDEANQLVREDFPGGDRTVVYAYDVGGNLRSRTWYQPTFGSLDNMEPTQVINYGYGDSNWADKLTSYNGNPVGTDNMGNITSFEDTQLTWSAGRQLETTTYHGETKHYYYNADGYIAKIVTSNASTGAQKEEIDYFWQDGKILALRQKDLLNDGDETIYEYLYDSDGDLQSIESGAFRFMLEKNLLGDIIGVSLVNIAVPNQPMHLMDVDYDAYGEPELLGLRENPSIGFITIFYMAISPVLYRGYLAISVGEHFCYYLGSRFYCPDLGRFLNADVYQDTQQGVVGANMFAYCNNNPVNLSDPQGEFSLPIIDEDNPVLGFYNTGGNKYVSAPWSTIHEPWQKNLGYCDFYDTAAPLAGIFIKSLVSEFQYGSYNWRIQLWKGRYGITLGCEVGIYRNLIGSRVTKIFGTTLYACSDKEYDMYIQLGYWHNNTADLIFDRSDQHWWLTGFVVYPHTTELNKNKPNSSNLIMFAGIALDNEKMAKLFTTHLKARSKNAGAYTTGTIKNVVFILWAPNANILKSII